MSTETDAARGIAREIADGLAGYITPPRRRVLAADIAAALTAWNQRASAAPPAHRLAQHPPLDDG